MAIILHIETATKNCAVALSQKNKIISTTKHCENGYIHGEKLHLFIKETLKKATIKINEIDAVAVSKGPGSYTGLRIGVAAAKGICYVIGKPLIAIDTLSILARNIIAKKGYIIPMIDARRMEVYTAVFNAVDYKIITPVEAKILDENAFENFIKKNTQLYFVGDGAEKMKGIFDGQQTVFKPYEHPCATQMVAMAYEKYNRRAFENLAYFEPYYLKDFIVTPPNKKIL